MRAAGAGAAEWLTPGVLKAIREYLAAGRPTMPGDFLTLQNRCLQLQLNSFAESAEALHTEVTGLAAALAPTDPGAAAACSLLACLALLHIDVHASAQAPGATGRGAGAGGGGAPPSAASVAPPYLEDAAAELARYRDALEQGQFSAGADGGDAAGATALFTPLYLYAASRIAQGRGQLKVQAAALSALKKWPEGKVASGSLLHTALQADEYHLEGLMDAAERAAGGGTRRAGTTTHAGGPSAAAVAVVHKHAGAAGLWVAKKADAAAAAAAAATAAAAAVATTAAATAAGTTAAAAATAAAAGGAGVPGVVTMPDAPAIDELMALVGLESVKRSVLALYDRVHVSRLRGEMGAPTDVPLNFRLVGNPGTGKTVVARLLARILAELGLRPGDEDAAAAAARQAATQAASDADLERQKQDLIKQAAQLGLAKAQAELAAARSALTAGRTALQSVSDTAAQASQLDPVRGSMGHYSAVFDQLKHNAASRRSELERLIAAHVAAEAACLTAVDAATARLQAAGSGAQTAATVAGAAASAVPPATSQRFVETSGGKLQQDGVAAFEATVQTLLSATPPGGVIFIDEAHQLVQSDTTGGGRDVVKRLIKYSEDRRDVLTFILAGYPKDIETLMEADEGLRRRFPEQDGNLLKFEDYSAGDLAAIFGSFLTRLSKSCPHPGIGWTLANARDAEIVGRRIARGAGRKGFGNAGVVEGLIKGPIMSRNAARIIAARAAGTTLTPREMFTLTQADVLGCEPAPESSAAYRALSDMVGLPRVKEAVRSLLLQMQAMWRDEQRGVTPQEVPRLNRLFLGPPGTGKTTVAKLYGQVLAECGFLSSGEVMVTQPSDFVGAVLGESERKTAQLLERAKGKVLVIDEVRGAGAGAGCYTASVCGEDCVADLVCYCGCRALLFWSTASRPGREPQTTNCELYDTHSPANCRLLAGVRAPSGLRVPQGRAGDAGGNGARAGGRGHRGGHDRLSGRDGGVSAQGGQRCRWQGPRRHRCSSVRLLCTLQTTDGSHALWLSPYASHTASLRAFVPPYSFLHLAGEPGLGAPLQRARGLHLRAVHQHGAAPHPVRQGREDGRAAALPRRQGGRGGAGAREQAAQLRQRRRCGGAARPLDCGTH
jgi:hypothetical protein